MGDTNTMLDGSPNVSLDEKMYHVKRCGCGAWLCHRSAAHTRRVIWQHAACRRCEKREGWSHKNTHFFHTKEEADRYIHQETVGESFNAQMVKTFNDYGRRVKAGDGLNPQAMEAFFSELWWVNQALYTDLHRFDDTEHRDRLALAYMGYKTMSNAVAAGKHRLKHQDGPKRGQSMTPQEAGRMMAKKVLPRVEDISREKAIPQMHFERKWLA